MRSPHVSWVFAQLVTFPIFGRGATWGWPSQSRLRRASVSAAASGAVCQWQTSSTDRRGSGDRPLGNVPPGRSGPKGRAKYVRRKKFAQSLVSPPPLGGRWCPVGTVQRLTEPAGESGLALARTERASCRPHHPLPWLSPLRARPPRSLVSFWLRAHKVKGKVEAFLKKSFTKKL